MGNKYEDTYINEWHILRRLPSGKYLCRCSCGVEKEHYISNLLKGIKSCGHERGIENKVFGSWTVKKDLGSGKVLCECECGTVKELYKKSLISGKTKSCGCKRTRCKRDLIGQTIGNWEVIDTAGNGYCVCRCKLCGNTRNVTRSALLNGKSTSCGCSREKNSDIPEDGQSNKDSA